MNDHSKDSQTRYLREAAIVLAEEGFQLDEVHTDRLCILLDGAPLCEVTESGGIAYRNKDIDEPERIAAKDKVYEIVRNTAEYMRQMETAPVLKADGLEDGYKVLADFNGTVLAGVQSKHGVHFVTWDWAYGHTGVCHGHYFMDEHYSFNITLQTLSTIACMSESKMKKLFKSVYNMSITEYIQRKRISVAEHMLIQTDLTIAEISRIVGYSNPSRLIEIFKRYYGFTPSKYRK